MAEITRPNLNVKAFAAEAQSGERTVFGDTTVTDDLTQNLSADYERGWGIVSGNDLPTKQDFNGAMFGQSALTAYLFQHGVSEWNSNQEYFHPAVVFGSDGELYASVKNSTGENPTTDSGANWKSALNDRFGGALLQGGIQGTTKNYNSSTDLDEYIEGGDWSFLASHANRPEPFDGTVFVVPNEKANRITQLALSQGSTRVFTATRNSFDNGATWTDWTRLSTRADINAVRGVTGAWTQSLNTSGWTRFPNGLIFQWGEVADATPAVTVTLPIQFPNAFLLGLGTLNADYVSAGEEAVAIYNKTLSNFTLRADNGAQAGAYWLAIGH